MPLPVLPPEIWRFILRYATEIPGWRDTSPLPPLSDYFKSWSSEWYHWYVRNDLATKSALTLVCSQWYDIAVEFLFEYISIDRLRTFLLLNQSLERSAEGIRNARSLGSHIKRLYISLDFALITPPFSYSCNQLLRLCTNLQCIFFRGKILPIPFLDLSALVERAPLLRACALSGTASHWLSPHLPRFYKELQRFNNIMFLSLTFNGDIVTVSDEPITLQNLHTMELNIADDDNISPILDMIALWNLPSLCSMDLTADRTEPDRFEAFFRSHGAKITTLTFQIPDDDVWPIASIIQLCPFVVDLGFNICILSRLSLHFPSYEGLHSWGRSTLTKPMRLIKHWNSYSPMSNRSWNASVCWKFSY